MITKIKFFFSVCFAVVFLAFAGFAVAGDTLFLWEVEGKRANHYLLGTVHIWKKENYPLPEPMEKAFSQTSILAVEVDPRGASFDARVMQRALYSQDDSLDRHLSDQLFDEVSSAASEFGLDARMIKRSKPWFLGSMLTVSAAIRAGYDAGSGIDAYLMQRATVEKKRILELETIDRQLQIFENMPLELQALFVKQVVELVRGGGAKKFLDELAAVWMIGDAEKMDVWLRRMLEDDPLAGEFFKSILADRNPAMTERIVELLEGEGSVLVAVGVGHLIGRDSIVELLRARGYIVRQVRR